MAEPISEGITPLFIFSLPRSGSTLLQRCLSSGPQAATVAEPWILLHLYSPLDCINRISVVDSDIAGNAAREFLSSIEGADEFFRQNVRQFVMTTYRGAVGAGGDSEYFIDKTPRYYLLIDQIAETFPDAKMIFLFRNPMAVAASIIETWGKGRWNLWKYYVDLYVGLEALLAGYRRHSDRSLALRYEDIVVHPNEAWEKISTYLQLDCDNNLLLSGTSHVLGGRYGDKKGDGVGQLVIDGLDSWRKVMKGIPRKIWCIQYAKLISQRLAEVGYRADEYGITLKVSDLWAAGNFSDALRMAYGYLENRLHFNLFGRSRARAFGRTHSLRLH